MKDPILYKNLLKEVEAGNVAVSAKDDLFIFKYTQDCHIEGRWNDVNRLARGLIMKANGEIVARPFAKFFNLGEVSETHPDNLPWHESVEVFEKVDGSCGIGYRSGVKWKLATPGSLESDQAIQGTHILQTMYFLDVLPQDCTPVFEIIYPANRIVVDYGGQTFLSLLAIFEKNGEEWHPNRVDMIARVGGFNRPARYNIDLRSEIPFAENTEGYVVRFESGLRVKIKSPAYLRIHRLLNYMSPKGVIELMRGREYGATLLSLPNHIRQDFDDIRAYVQQMHDSIVIRAHDNVRRARDIDANNRKNQALWVLANVKPEERGFVFSLLDNHNIEDKVWELVLDKVREERKINEVCS